MKKLILLMSLLLVVLALLVGCSQPTAVAAPKPQVADVIFTKWVTTAGVAPVIVNMAGVVSGDTGPGLYAGEVLEYNNPSAPVSTLVADYHIKGGIHQFTAHLNVTMDNTKGTANITGVVSDGWLKGAAVTGGFQVIAPCGIINAQQGAQGDVAFQGTLHLEK